MVSTRSHPREFDAPVMSPSKRLAAAAPAAPTTTTDPVAARKQFTDLLAPSREGEPISTVAAAYAAPMRRVSARNAARKPSSGSDTTSTSGKDAGTPPADWHLKKAIAGVVIECGPQFFKT